MKKTKRKKSVRLPNHISPTNYKLTIKPDLESFTFSGNEIIKIKITQETNKITLHSKDIDVETAMISCKGEKQKQFTTKIVYNTEHETVTLFFKNKIKGNCELHLSFYGLISNNLRGFYRSKYILDGKEKYLATTQFEATDARRAFPCFDEPAQKAIFEVSLVISKNHSAISNTLPAKIKEHENYKVVSFSPSPRMSTYLLAFIIGEFEYIEGKTKNNVSIRVFTTKGKSHQAKFALEVAIKSLEFFNEYFDIPYPLPILDLIAIPDFESAAMENWGAITFRETAILVDEKNTSISSKQWVAIVIAHELAHQWFGNLVTMAWWTDLWLNEGFASYMENLCVNQMFPNWHIWDMYVSDRYAIALKLDSLSTSHPIETKVHHPNEISEIFDMVSYAKGSAIIRMLAEYLGKDKFRNGLRQYLKKHSYKNANTLDLWNAFEKVSNKPVNQIMSSWTQKTGYPLLTVTQKGKKFYLSQERFFSSRISSKQNKIKKLWQIPVGYESLTTQKNNKEVLKILLTKTKAPLLGTSVGKVNKEEETFTRVRYDKETLANLKIEIENGSLSTKDRLGIIRDLFALAEGGYIDTKDALEFSLSYKNETEFIVWSEIAGGINKIANIIKNESFSIKYNKYALSLFGPLVNKMSWNPKNNESHSDIFLRNLALSQSAHYGDIKIINEAKILFKKKDISPIRVDIRGVVYGIIAANGNIKEWNLFEKLYKKEQFNEEKERIARALSSFRDKKLLLKTLKLALSSNVKNQDTPFIIANIWANKYGQDITWKFIKDNWKEIVKNYGEGGHFLSRLLSPLGNHTTLKDLKNIKAFFSKNIAPGAERTLIQSYEKIESNIAWLKDDKKSIKNWLEKNY